MAKREVDIVVISDVHLGTYGCHAKELLKYLKSIKPKKLVLNGDIIDIWQFSKSYWPESHMKVVRRILKFVTDGVPVYYLTGNHDEMLRKFADFNLGTFQLMNKLVLELDNKKAWIFHGDVFDVTMQHSKWLAKLGAVGYDSLIVINSMVNWFLTAIGKQKMSFSQKIKGKVKEAVKFINHFEQTAADLAVDKKYDYVICGHIHHAEIRTIKATDNPGEVLYLNSGDWVESLTALEYYQGKWEIFKYQPADFMVEHDDEDKTDAEDLDNKLDVRNLLEKFKQEAH
ncbi:UDP-2,3-diacylglucosamine diphosphatase [Mucilaginibacter sp. KACC 22063]|uniref:UDP-2,3-diacylglucosamine diphosphatase n=1 Tax=Mucilaginibacter sp. KACC 22063 TaxID=3025666 RepID=UPI00236610A5|nr:UDP-2,3-diacylglucosamine diphosphatase [Mucilaginibacter sp. KACC 22063]WDF55088.1 UDP-2,3-diacylglucosamine diphosphatase [Mucilaginibacter sp. KACC 22063]